MKLLIMGPPTSDGYRAFGLKNNITGGGWVENLIKNLSIYCNDELEICDCFYCDFVEKVEEKIFEGVCFYAMPIRVKGLASCNEAMTNDIHEVLSDCTPDIVHIIGTEREHNLRMLEEAGADRCVVSITGMVSYIAQHYYGGIPERHFSHRSIGDILRRGGPIVEKKLFSKYGNNEKKLISQAQYIMGRTTWDYACVKQINDRCDYIYCSEILNNLYYENLWTDEKIQKNRIFLSQGTYPLKGFHMIIEAMPIILKQYPDTEIYVAGADILKKNSFIDRIKRTTYAEYLDKLIKKYRLKGKIHFTGPLDANGMLEQYLKCNVFVLPSAIENSPNSLGEAMSLGVPCVASCVGGVQDMLKDKEEGFIYPFDEPYMLAHYVCKIFENPQLATEIGRKGRERAKKRFDAGIVAKTTLETYSMVYDGIKSNKTK